MNDEFDLASAIDAIFDFCTKVLRIVAPLVPAVKLNIAYFEKYLWEGLESYYSLISEADALGVEVIGDVKRGDIGHTAKCYAQAHLQNPELTGLEDVIAPDAITINGFAGADGILPFADIANDQGKGVFVWVRASNPTAGAIGMVVGGTSPEETTALRGKYPKVWFLVPGFGSQGASAADCARFCKDDHTGALINASRSIIYAYEKPQYKAQFGDNWQKCIEQAVIDAKIELAKVM